MAYTVLFVVFSLAVARLARRPVLSYAGAAALIAGGTVAVLADGRLGAAPLALEEVSVVRAGAGLDGAQVQVRARGVFPAAGHVDVRTSLQDAEISWRRGGHLAVAADAAGSPMLTGRVARQQVVEFEVDGFVPSAPVAVTEMGRTVTIENRLSSALTGCSLPDGFTAPSLARIEPGAIVRLDTPGITTDAALVCTIERPEARVAWSGGAVALRARAVLVVDLRGTGVTP